MNLSFRSYGYVIGFLVVAWSFAKRLITEVDEILSDLKATTEHVLFSIKVMKKRQARKYNQVPVVVDRYRVVHIPCCVAFQHH